jgi:hypothetical protein
VRFGVVRYPIENGFVANHAERPRLLIDRAGRLDGRVDDLADRSFVDRLSGKFAHRTSGVDRFLEVHFLSACC